MKNYKLFLLTFLMLAACKTQKSSILFRNDNTFTPREVQLIASTYLESNDIEKAKYATPILSFFPDDNFWIVTFEPIKPSLSSSNIRIRIKDGSKEVERLFSY